MYKNNLSSKIWVITILLILSEALSAQAVYVPDDNFEQNLIGKGLDDVLDNYVLADNIKDVWNLNVQFNNISDLTGIEGFTSLRFLYCGWNNLESLDLSKNPTLEELYISDDSTLSSLDLSSNTSLKYLYCPNSNFCVINIKNGNNSNFRGFDARNNPNLECIQVDNASWSIANWVYKDSQTNFSDVPCSNSCEKKLLVSNLDTEINFPKLDMLNLSIAADGSSSTLFKYVGGNPQDIELQFKEQLTSNPNFYGEFQEGVIVGDTLKIMYNHPKYFFEPDTEFPSPQNKELTLEVKDKSTGTILLEYPIKIVRPSVLMVHGIWSNSIDSFLSMQNYLESNGLYNSLQTLKVDYKSDQSNILSAPIYIRYKKALKSMARRANISMGKFDVLAHSNGGVLSRQYIQSPEYKHDINKLITFNTPHSGSQLTNLLLDPDFFILHPALVANGMNPTNGVIYDLKVDGTYVQNLNDISQYTDIYSEIGIHAITSTETIDNIVGYWDKLLVYYLKFHWEEALDYALENYVFYSPNHDIIVPLDSQIAGCAATTLFEGQQHSGSTSQVRFQDRAIELLNKNPRDVNYFSTDGYNPPVLTSNFNSFKQIQNIKSKTESETITITNPTEGSEFKTGQNVNIIATGSSGIENIVSSMSGSDNILQTHVTENSTNTNFDFTIPNNALGRLEIVTSGFSLNGFEGFDSTYIMVTTDALLESIEIDQSLIFVSVEGESVITILGHYDDGVIRNITNIENLVYAFDEQNAEIKENGLVTGLIEGDDMLTVSYAGKSTTVPITIVNSIALSIEETNNKIDDFIIFPNPTKDLLTIKFPANQIKAEVGIYNLLGQNVLSREISSSDNELNIGNLQNGMYLVKIKIETSTITKRIIKQ